MNLRGVIFDLDGTVYRGHEEVPGAARLIGQLRARGIRSLFVTNRANRPPERVHEQLRDLGIPCSLEDILTSAEATAEYLPPGSVYLIGEEGIRRALEQKGFTFTSDKPDYVIVSFDREFTYAKMKIASWWISRGSRFVATNPDRALRMDDGVVPGTGSIVAGVSAATGQLPLVIGKPETRIMEIALRRMGLPASDVIAVGDNLETDVPAGVHAGLTTILILTGISTREELPQAKVAPHHVVADYAELARLVGHLGGPVLD